MDNHKYIIAIDQGTSATKVLLFNEAGTLINGVTGVHKQYYPKPGWVEQDALEIYTLTCDSIKNLIRISGIDEKSLLALAITNQTGAFVVWDKQTGEPIYHLVGWQCNRGDEISKRITAEQAQSLREKCGSDPSPYSTATKLQWLLENVGGLKERAARGEVLFGTIDSYLIWKFTGGKVHATDYSNAGNTNLFNLYELEWDNELLRIFQIPKCILPEVKNADADFGIVEVDGLPSLPITGVMGDSAAALFAQCGFDQGNVKITYGTGASILMNLGSLAVPPPEGVTTTVAWGMKSEGVTYVWEGTVMYAGDLIEWLVNDALLLENAASSASIALEVENNEGVYMIPSCNGDIDLIGVNRGTKRSHLVRAALESIAYQIKDMTDSMLQKSNCKIPYILVDGGVARNDMLMQFQSDILNIPIIRSELEENSALGAAYMAGLAMGLYKDKKALCNLRHGQENFIPGIADEKRAIMYEGWKRAAIKAAVRAEKE